MEVMNDCCPCECGIEASCADAHDQAIEDSDECIQFKWGEEFTCASVVEYCDDPDFRETVMDCCPATCEANGEGIFCENDDVCLQELWDSDAHKCSWVESYCYDPEFEEDMELCCPATCGWCPDEDMGRSDDDECLEFFWGEGYKCDWNTEYCNDVEHGK